MINNKDLKTALKVYKEYLKYVASTGIWEIEFMTFDEWLEDELSTM